MIPLRDTNPRRTVPFVTYALVAVNVLGFLWELSLGAQLERALFAVSFIPARFWIAGNWVADLTTIAISMFLHGSLMHIGSNMLYLWIFGDNIEDRLGHGKFLVFYLACGYLATLAHAFFSPGSRLPAIGASGAIAGVLGAYLILVPHARVLTLIPIFFFITLRELPDAQDMGGVAYFAHIGGFVAGILLIAAFGGLRGPRRREPPPPWWAER